MLNNAVSEYPYLVIGMDRFGRIDRGNIMELPDEELAIREAQQEAYKKVGIKFVVFKPIEYSIGAYRDEPEIFTKNL
jgi:hypothetical protein